ncbi:hypothetical protein AC625_20635 [Peribacillus loiseleuriae]|uniref:Sin domain-containing protein n=2 Tax=Peribacillus loiseleuriae TaxID=1679170 RepID=A0A0K9GYF6_9BACI|nr:hypothetical protein AC625_20635 [Peribacillus loiseleuriae]
MIGTQSTQLYKNKGMVFKMKLVEETQREEFDFEWVTLMLTAKQIGITPTEVRKFLQESQKLQSNKKGLNAK